MNLWLPWDQQWWALTALSCVLAIPALRWLPAPDRSAVTKTGQAMKDAPPSELFMRLLIAAYCCAGIGYVISATFIVAIVDHIPGMQGNGTLVFFVIGIAAAPSCIAWDLIARRIGKLNALFLAAVLQIVGIMLPVFAGGLIPALLGAILFGGTVMGIVSLVLTMAGDCCPPVPPR